MPWHRMKSAIDQPALRQRVLYAGKQHNVNFRKAPKAGRAATAKTDRREIRSVTAGSESRLMISGPILLI